MPTDYKLKYAFDLSYIKPIPKTKILKTEMLQVI